MVKSAVRVFVRVRPASGVNSHAHYAQDGKGITLSVPKSADVTGTVQHDKQGVTYQFKFDGVLKDVAQEEMYEACATDVLRGALEGYNGCIMCYGQTGAGKTFTMSGGRSSFKQRGIIPRMISHLFAEMRSLSDRQFKVSIQYLEIYNEALYDLLDISTQPDELNIYENSRGVVTVSGLKSKVVGSEAEAMQLLFEGETNRVIGEHQLNRESSRSHSIFTISLEMKMPGEAGDVVTSKVNLVDLAGSERVSKTKSEGLVLREACHINKSLSILEQVSLALASKGRDHVPFRSSKLTHVVKDSLGGNCKTVLIANVWGEASQMDETLSTCRFAQRMMCITCEVSANVVEDQSVRSRQLSKQILELQQELAMHDAMAGRKDVVYAPYNDAQRTDLTAMVRTFLTSQGPSDSIEPLQLISVRHMREILYCCRELYSTAAAANGGGGGGTSGRQGTPNGTAAAASGSQPGAPSTPSAAVGSAAAAAGSSGRGGQAREGSSSPAPDAQWPEYTEGDGGGRIVTAGSSGHSTAALLPDAGGGAGGGGDGEAAGGSGGAGMSAVEKLLMLQQQDDQQQRQHLRSGSGASTSASTPTNVPLDKHEALEAFKAGQGAAKASLLEENRSRLKASKRRAKELGLGINAAKRELDALKSRADELKQQRQAQQGDGAQVLDAEEYDALMRIKELKQQYREQFTELQMVRSEVEYTQQLCDTCAKELAMEFNEWYCAAHGGAGLGLDSLSAGLLEEHDAGMSIPGPVSPSARSMANSVTSTASSKAAASRPAAAGVAGKGPAAAGAQGAKLNGSNGAGAGRGMPGAGQAKSSPTSTGAKPARKILSSLVTPPEDAGDPDAAAYYAAQQQLLQHANGVHRPGSVKKTRVPAAFGATQSAGKTTSKP